MLFVTEKVCIAHEKSKPCMCLFTDLFKAFDERSQPLLLDTLQQIGREKRLELFENYLSDKI